MLETLYKQFSTVVRWKYFMKAEDLLTAKGKFCRSIFKITELSTK